MTYTLPLVGHDMPEWTQAEIDALAASRRKARVHGQLTPVGQRWEWEHECRWKGYALTNSYPLPSWEAAFGAALEHLKDCP